MAKKDSLDLRNLAATAKEEVTQAKAEPTPVDKREELTPREIKFTLEYDAPSGEDLSAELTSKVLDADGRLARSRVFNQLSRGMVFEALSQEDKYRIDALSRMAVQLQDAPQWVIDAAGEDIDLLVYINNTLMEHESRYFRGNTRTSSEGEVKPRVRVSVPTFEKRD